MNILQIFGVGLIVAILAALLNEIKKEYALIAVVCGGVIIMLAVIPGLAQLMASVKEAAQKADINTRYVIIVIKCSGIACIASICGAMCRDMGQSAVATKLELAGRIAIMITALPAITALLELIERTI
ncbi:MAG: SpoIIIAC/SpoIIIAD family protein [Bacillota bacterium]|nr:SpoIIIAC/SpoIIIAD family protein [Bacillota bacterium]